MNTYTKVFKLVNGEEIIGTLISDSEESMLKISNPMIFKTATILDTKGVSHEITILKDWMFRADNKIADLSKDQVSISFVPNKKTLELYNLELSKTELPLEEIVDSSDIKNSFVNPLDQIMDSFMNNINDLIDQVPPPPQRKRKKKRKTRREPPMDESELDMSDLIPDELKERPMIYLSMVIPPECIMNLMTAGILDPEHLLEMIKEVKKKNNFTGDEKNREDFGSKFTDWNPDPKSSDYDN
jgi:hypothetical protein